MQTSQASCSFKETGLQGGRAQVICGGSPSPSSSFSLRTVWIYLFLLWLLFFIHPKASLRTRWTSGQLYCCTFARQGQGANWPVRPRYGDILGLFCGIKPPWQGESASLPFPSTLGPSEITLRKYLKNFFPTTSYIFAHHLTQGQFPALGGYRHPPQGWGRAGLLCAHRHCVLGKAWGHPRHSLHSSGSLWLCCHQQTHRHGPPPPRISAHWLEQDKANWPQSSRRLEDTVPLLAQVVALHASLIVPEGENNPEWDPRGHPHYFLWMWCNFFHL